MRRIPVLSLAIIWLLAIAPPLAWQAERGIAAGRVDSTGLGESSPVADNSTPQARALSRRVEVVAQR